jgi:hypothetical protein
MLLVSFSFVPTLFLSLRANWTSVYYRQAKSCYGEATQNINLLSSKVLISHNTNISRKHLPTNFDGGEEKNYWKSCWLEVSQIASHIQQVWPCFSINKQSKFLCYFFLTILEAIKLHGEVSICFLWIRRDGDILIHRFCFSFTWSIGTDLSQTPHPPLSTQVNFCFKKINILSSYSLVLGFLTHH